MYLLYHDGRCICKRTCQVFLTKREPRAQMLRVRSTTALKKVTKEVLMLSYGKNAQSCFALSAFGAPRLVPTQLSPKRTVLQTAAFADSLQRHMPRVVSVLAGELTFLLNEKSLNLILTLLIFLHCLSRRRRNANHYSRSVTHDVRELAIPFCEIFEIL